MGPQGVSAEEPVIWHDVECGGYAADLPLWEELADTAAGPVLELGCGTGRVSLHLARRGHRVSGLDTDQALAEAFNQRAESLPARALLGDAVAFALEDRFSLAIAPMQLIQLLPGSEARTACLRCVAEHLQPGGLFALALVEEVPAMGDAPPLPDAREVDGWVYSSLPLDVRASDGAIVVRRLRQTVSPAGELRDAEDRLELQMLSAGLLEAEGRAAGLRPRERRRVPETDAHVGSTVVVLERES
jgi:SAM-dependent methyltransferase